MMMNSKFLKFLIILVGVVSLQFGAISTAQAMAFIDFDAPDFSLDPVGDNPHTIATSLGSVSFNGRISNTFRNSSVADHTTGSDYFLKNTGAEDVITFTFDFDVTSFSLWVQKYTGAFTVEGAAYDGSDALVDSGSFDAASGIWTFNDIDSLSSPIRKLVISSSNSVGNNFILDDLTLNSSPTVPEPASLILLSGGMLGLYRTRRKKLS